MITETEIHSVLDLKRLSAELDIDIDQARFEEIVRDTPSSVREIAHYATLWGISDDGYRGDMIRGASEQARRNLKAVVNMYEDSLEEWLTGDEAQGPEFSEAYVAFSAMVMASDEIQLR